MTQSRRRQLAGVPVVFFLIDQLQGWRGTETHLFRLLTTLHPQRLRAIVGVLGEADLAGEYRAAGIAVHELAVYDLVSLQALLSIRRIARLLRREDARLLVSYHTASDLLAPVVSRLAGIPTLSCRRDEGFTKRRRHVALQRLLNPLVDGMISVSQAVARAVARAEGFPLQRNRVIWNGEDLELFKPGPSTIRHELGIGADECVISCVAGLDPAKDHATLLRAFAIVVREHPRARLLLVGAGDERQRLEEYARPFGERVVFLGRRRDVPDVLRCSDIYAQTSTTEGFSNSILQAMASGLPIVATRVGGNPEMVTESSGFLVEAADSVGVSQALARLIADPDLRRHLGQASRRWAEQHGSLGRMATAYREALEQALKGEFHSSAETLA